jgi:hypothetical protein
MKADTLAGGAIFSKQLLGENRHGLKTAQRPPPDRSNGP